MLYFDNIPYLLPGAVNMPAATISIKYSTMNFIKNVMISKNTCSKHFLNQLSRRELDASYYKEILHYQTLYYHPVYRYSTQIW